MSAAYWTNDHDGEQEVWGEPDNDRHIVSVQCSSHHAEVWKDGRAAFTKTVERGTTSIMEAGVRPRAIQRGPWKVLHLYVPAALITSLAEAHERPVSAGRLELINPQCARDTKLEWIGREVLAEIGSGAPLSRLRIDVLGQDLAIQLLRAHSNLAGTRTPTQARGGLPAHLLRRVQERLEDAITADTTLTELAAVAGLSEHHLCRAFRQSTGAPPHQWLLARRIESARELLAATDRSVAEIAAAVGYDDPSYFALCSSTIPARRRWLTGGSGAGDPIKDDRQRRPRLGSRTDSGGFRQRSECCRRWRTPHRPGRQSGHVGSWAWNSLRWLE